jgi:formate/nitrite transporter
MENGFLTPPQVAEGFIETGVKKASLTIPKQLVLGILAGAYIAFAAEGSNAAIHTIASVGIAKALAGALFSAGLMLVVIGGAELFTGNCLMVVAVCKKRIGLPALLRNWCFVYIGNFIGALLIALLIRYSGQLGFSDGLLGAFTIKTAVYKVGLPFGRALIMGILCNWLVCLAVWLAAAAKDVTGKILAIFFPIWLFIASGFEHCVANMYYVPAGILAKTDGALFDAAVEMGVSAEQIDGLTWGSFLSHNLLPVTIGNIIGGAVFVGFLYSFLYLTGKGKQGVK